MEALGRELDRSKRSGRAFAVIMMDLDQFKPVNDQFGHLQGDRVLRMVAKLLNDQLRHSSVVARYGGDGLSVLLPDTTERQARSTADRLCKSIEAEPLLVTYHVTASFGIAAFPEHGETCKQILHMADTGMYLAKHESGNRVRVATDDPKSGQVEAYFDVELKRRFSTGPEAFNGMLKRLEAAKEEGEVRVVDALTSLARAIDLSDPYTRNHRLGVARVAEQIARQLQLPAGEVVEIRNAAILHDIGKIGIPDVILHKPAPSLRKST